MKYDKRGHRVANRLQDLFIYYFWCSMQGRIEAGHLIEKMAVFENQLTTESKTMRLLLCYCDSSNLVNLTLTFKISNLERQLLPNSQFFYMDVSTRMCQFLGVYPFNEDIFVEIDHKVKQKLHFRFRKMGGATVHTPLSPQVKEPLNSQNIRKSGERTIGEVRQHLQNRNKLYRNASQGYTLQQAADIIGLPKKTLDDYDRHIRIAEAYGFDFQQHKHSGMGVLRSFVKEQSSKQKVDQWPKQEFIEPGCFLSMGPPGLS